MKVYVVYGIFRYEGAEVVKIFREKEKANAYAAEWHRKKKRSGRGAGSYDDMGVEETEVE